MNIIAAPIHEMLQRGVGISCLELEDTLASGQNSSGIKLHLPPNKPGPFLAKVFLPPFLGFVVRQILFHSYFFLVAELEYSLVLPLEVLKVKGFIYPGKCRAEERNHVEDVLLWCNHWAPSIPSAVLPISFKIVIYTFFVSWLIERHITCSCSRGRWG